MQDNENAWSSRPQDDNREGLEGEPQEVPSTLLPAVLQRLGLTPGLLAEDFPCVLAMVAEAADRADALAWAYGIGTYRPEAAAVLPRALLASATRAVKPAASRTAMSARILRSSSTPAVLRP